MTSWAKIAAPKLNAKQLIDKIKKCKADCVTLRKELELIQKDIDKNDNDIREEQKRRKRIDFSYSPNIICYPDPLYLMGEKDSSLWYAKNDIETDIATNVSFIKKYTHELNIVQKRNQCQKAKKK